MQALWHKFSGEDDRINVGLGLINPPKSLADSDSDWDTLCLFGKQNLDVYESKGQHFTTTLPFDVDI